MGAGPLVVTYPLTGRSRMIVEEELGGTAEAIYLVDLAAREQADQAEIPRAGHGITRMWNSATPNTLNSTPMT